MPFNTLSDDDFLSLHTNNFSDNELFRPNNFYENLITQHLNFSSQNLEIHLDADDPVQRNMSKYITVNQLSNISRNFDNDTFSALHANIRSMNRHFDELLSLIDKPLHNPFSLVGLTETWIKENSNLPFHIDGYDFIHKNRNAGAGGGVAFYIKKSLNYNILDEFSICNPCIESLFIEIEIPGNKNIIAGVIYRSPSSNAQEFLQLLSTLLRDIGLANKEFFLMGDFNIDLLNHELDNVSLEFLELILSSSCLPLISKPTRCTDNSATLIDNIFSNALPSPNSYIIVSDITDHYPICTHFPLKKINNAHFNAAQKRNFTPENLTLLKSNLDNIDWSYLYSIDDLDISFEHFSTTLRKQIDTDIPLQKIKNSYKKIPRLPWISKSILRSINRKNNLFYKYKTDITINNKAKYISYKNTLTNIIRIEKRKYFENRLSIFKHDTKNTWKVIKQAMNSTIKKSEINKIRSNGRIIESPKCMSNTFNNYFSSIGNNLAKNIPLSRKNFTDFLGPLNHNSIFFLPTNRNEIINIVSKLKNKKSSGFDEIDNVILKSIILSIVDPLVHIFNLSLLHGKFPNLMKIAKIIPLFKKGDKLELGNYRPISLLTSFSKLLEKIIFARMTSFLKRYDILSRFQFGFREKHNTTHALLSFIEKVALSIDSSSHTVGVFLDFSKAFDTINHDILLSKLSHIGVRGKALEWFRSYLSNRKQFVYLNEHESDFKEITCGVPQGSILGPLLFIIYINDFHKCTNSFSFICFADDTNLFFSHKNPDVLVNTINAELLKVSEWIKANKLSLNLLKTNYILFSNSLNSLPNDITFDNTTIEQVTHTKFLGVLVDNKLSWKSHIENICQTISRNIGVIYRLKSYLPKSSLLKLYSSLILPYLNYGLLVWGNGNKASLEKVSLLQNKAIRIICNAHFRADTDPLFYKHKILKIGDLHKVQLGKFMFNYNSKTLPITFHNMFPKNSAVHNYPTRQSENLHTPLLRTLSAQKTFIFEGPKFWNALQDDIKCSASLATFKRKLKLSLLAPYNTKPR